MKNLKYVVLLFSVICFISLTGCGKSEDRQTQSTQEKSQQVVNQTPSTTTNEQNAMPSAEVSDDNQKMTMAINQRSKELCQEIQSSSVESQCLESIDALETTDSAIASKNKALCVSIEGSELRQNCENLVQQAQDLDSKIANENDQTKKDFELSGKALQEGDIKICDQISSENIKAGCKLNFDQN